MELFIWILVLAYIFLAPPLFSSSDSGISVRGEEEKKRKELDAVKAQYDPKTYRRIA